MDLLKSRRRWVLGDIQRGSCGISAGKIKWGILQYEKEGKGSFEKGGFQGEWKPLDRGGRTTLFWTGTGGTAGADRGNGVYKQGGKGDGDVV